MTSSYNIFVNSDWKNKMYMSHDNYFYRKKLKILLTPYNIYQKQKQNQIILFQKIIMALLVKQVFVKVFPYRNSPRTIGLIHNNILILKIDNNINSYKDKNLKKTKQQS